MISYPAEFYILDDGTWLIKDPNAGGWFHIPNLLPFIRGYFYDPLSPTELNSLQKRCIAKCNIGFEFQPNVW